MEHEPRGLLRDPERAPQLMRADAVLGVGDQPYGGQRLVEAELGVLEDDPELDAVLLLAALALPEPSRGQVGVFDAAAARAAGPSPTAFATAGSGCAAAAAPR